MVNSQENRTTNNNNSRRSGSSRKKSRHSSSSRKSGSKSRSSPHRSSEPRRSKRSKEDLEAKEKARAKRDSNGNRAAEFADGVYHDTGGAGVEPVEVGTNSSNRHRRSKRRSQQDRGISKDMAAKAKDLINRSSNNNVQANVGPAPGAHADSRGDQVAKGKGGGVGRFSRPLGTQSVFTIEERARMINENRLEEGDQGTGLVTANTVDERRHDEALAMHLLNTMLDEMEENKKKSKEKTKKTPDKTKMSNASKERKDKASTEQTRDEEQEERKRKRNMIIICIMCLLLVIVAAIVGWIFGTRGGGDDDKVVTGPSSVGANVTESPASPSPDSPSNFPSTTPTFLDLYEPPDEDFCRLVAQNRTTAEEREGLEQADFGLTFDVTLETNGDITAPQIFTLSKAIQDNLAPRLLGCAKDDVSRRNQEENSMIRGVTHTHQRQLALGGNRYIIADAFVRAKEIEKDCTKTRFPAQCHTIFVELSVFLKNPIRLLDIIVLISEKVDELEDEGDDDFNLKKPLKLEYPFFNVQLAKIDPLAPTTAPSMMPTNVPNILPSSIPSETPSTAAPGNPDAIITPSPTVKPTLPEATPFPTARATPPPTTAPSLDPTFAPVVGPTPPPTTAPSLDPTFAPVVGPTPPLTVPPTVQPSATPSSFPSSQPSASPSELPPSSTPSHTPSSQPSTSPSELPPSSTPSHTPSSQPSTSPSKAPSNTPTMAQSEAPTERCFCTTDNACTGTDLDSFTIGCGSCIVDESCDTLQTGAVISTFENRIQTNSCTATNSCSGATINGIAEGSCTAENACSNREIRAAATSCTGVNSCDGVGSGTTLLNIAGYTVGSLEVGEGSCTGQYGCLSYSGTVGFKSCLGEKACAGRNVLDIGRNSCTEQSSCRALRINGSFWSTVSSLTVGQGSCKCNGCCACVQTVGDNQCNVLGQCCKANGDVADSLPPGVVSIA